MKTAMQELIDGLLHRGILIDSKTYLEKEKQQIIDSYELGTVDAYEFGEQYYNETFKHLNNDKDKA